MSAFDIRLSHSRVHGINMRYLDPRSLLQTAGLSATSSTDLNFHGIWSVSDEDVHAVGQQGLILHYDSQRWRTAFRTNTDTTLVRFCCSAPNVVFAAGDPDTVSAFNSRKSSRACADMQHNVLHGDFN